MMLAYIVDVKLLCSLFAGCGNLSVRLVGSSLLEGRLEVCHSGVWATVCPFLFDVFDATVACRHLGYSPLGN